MALKKEGNRGCTDGGAKNRAKNRIQNWRDRKKGYENILCDTSKWVASKLTKSFLSHIFLPFPFFFFSFLQLRISSPKKKIAHSFLLCFIYSIQLILLVFLFLFLFSAKLQS